MPKSVESESRALGSEEPVSGSKPVMYLNGKMVPVAEAKLSVIDHGFLYGDGLFEGIRAYNGRVWKLNEHMDRLYRGAHVMLIDLPISKKEMGDAVRRTLSANGMSNAYIRVTVSRGIGLGLDPKNIVNPTIAIMTSELALYPASMYENGLELVTVSTRVARPDSLEVRVKSTGKYVANIQAKFEANRQGAGEALLLNSQGYVAEATGDNIFIVRNGHIITPPPTAGILEGITRASVMEIASAAGDPVIEDNMSQFDVYSADEVFLTGTAAEMIPVSRVDARVIGNGKPGPVTRAFIEKFHARTKNEGVSIAD